HPAVQHKPIYSDPDTHNKSLQMLPRISCSLLVTLE
ncbi:hypothetical protein HHX47_DHR10000431, partial [Lentinula edodes]